MVTQLILIADITDIMALRKAMASKFNTIDPIATNEATDVITSDTPFVT